MNAVLRRAVARIKREVLWKTQFAWRSSVVKRIDPDLSLVESGLSAAGIQWGSFEANMQGFHQFLEDANYPTAYHGDRGTIFLEKSFEHYLSFCLLQFRASDTYVDIASAGSPFPDLVKLRIGCKVFRNDLSYPAGMGADGRIGANATRLPLADRSVDKATLHCSFEHFEGDADTGLILELERLLAPSGKACILPLYLHSSYSVLTDPFADSGNLQFEPDAQIVYMKDYGQRHGRFYDAVHLQRRVLSQVTRLTAKLLRVTNLASIAGGLWCHWALLLEAPADEGTQEKNN